MAVTQREMPNGEVILENIDHKRGLIEIRGIVFPRSGQEVGVAVTALVEYLEGVAEAARSLYYSTVSTWDYKPNFYVRHATKDGADITLRSFMRAKAGEGGDVKRENSNGVVKQVPPATQIYEWLDKGTPAHTITAKAKSSYEVQTGKGTIKVGFRGQPLLVFHPEYTARSSPNSLRSGESSYGSAVRKAESVQHPGIAPRNYTGQISEILQKKVDVEAPRVVADAVSAFQTGKQGAYVPRAQGRTLSASVSSEGEE